MTDGSDASAHEATLYNINQGSGGKLLIPEGTTVIFTLVVNDDDTLLLSYVIN